MSSGRLLLVGYAIASILIGLGAGQWFFRLFDNVVPPAVTTSFNRAAAHGYFLLNGAFLGVVIAIWGMLAFWFARMTGERSTSTGQFTK